MKVRHGTNGGTEGSLGKTHVQEESEALTGAQNDARVAGIRKVVLVHIYRLQ